MRARLLCLTVCVAVLLPFSGRVFGHHSFAGEFEAYEKTYTGTVTKMMFRTPHAQFFMDVKDSSGTVVNWGFELPSPEQLQRRGLGRTSIKIGEQLTIVAYPAKDNQPLAMTRTVSLPEGRLVFVWDYEDFGATKSDVVVVDPTGQRLER